MIDDAGAKLEWGVGSSRDKVIYKDVNVNVDDFKDRKKYWKKIGEKLVQNCAKSFQRWEFIKKKQ